jgi:hypothetical protein
MLKSVQSSSYVNIVRYGHLHQKAPSSTQDGVSGSPASGLQFSVDVLCLLRLHYLEMG